MFILKRSIAFSVALCILFALSGCFVSKEIENRNEGDETPKYVSTYCDYPIIEGFTPIQREDYYAYSKLTDVQKDIYNGMVKMAEEFSLEAMYFEGSEKDDITIAYNAFTDDYPQFFWVGHTYEYSERGGWSGISFDVDGGFIGVDNIEERDEMNAKVNDAVKNIITSNVTPEMSDYEKELKIHDYICENMTYNHDVVEKAEGQQTEEDRRNWNILGGLFDKTGVCESYSKLFQLLLYNMGIPCTQLSGYTDERHMWNAVKIDGKWCYVDVTWDDLEVTGLEYNHSCFNMDETILGYEHKKYSSNLDKVTNDDFQIGEFNFFNEKVSRDNYYYKKEGLVVDKSNFESVVVPALKEKWDRSTAAGEFCVLGNEISMGRVNLMIGDLDIYHKFPDAKSIKYIKLPSGNAFALYVTKEKD